MPRLHIRDAATGDAAALGALFSESWREAYAGLLPDQAALGSGAARAAAGFARRLGGHGRRSGEGLLVAEYGTGKARRLAGFAEFGASRDPSLGCAAEVTRLYVHPDCQGEGVGSALLDAVFARISDAGRQGVVIWALAANPHRWFYAGRGGAPAAWRTGTIFGAPADEVAYVWPGVGAKPAPRVGG